MSALVGSGAPLVATVTDPDLCLGGGAIFTTCSLKLSSNVLIVTISDFGRTPSANLSLGTDHGSASSAFVLGDMVKGGVYGDYPSLKTFDSTGNLAVNVDFRNMLSDVIQALGGNAKAVLGTTYPKLGFI